MSTENIETSVEPVTDDLDAFSAELFGQSEANPEPASSEKEEVVEQESDATDDNEDTQTDETDTLETEDEDETQVTETQEEPKKPKNRFQERIDELTARAREAERREQEMVQRFKALEEKLNQPKNDQPEPSAIAQGPAPTDLNEDGTEKYPLGEFDPQYIRDLTKFTLAEEVKARDAREAERAREEQYATEKAQLQENWTQKLGPAKERYPDFQEKGEQLFDTFAGIDQKYGEYLTATLMSMDYGPDVLYYLANNLDVANQIVNSGPTRATMALGRLEAKFADAEAEKQKARPKVSKAPNPPETLKGSSAVLPEVPDDTDDLDAFSRKLFKKKK